MVLCRGALDRLAAGNDRYQESELEMLETIRLEGVALGSEFVMWCCAPIARGRLQFGLLCTYRRALILG